MSLTDVSVRRPVFAIMMAAALIVLGAGVLHRSRHRPDAEHRVPVVTVSAILPGASAEEIETQLTKRIEEAVNTISGIDELDGRPPTRASRASSITFTLERDIDAAVQDVRDKVATRSSNRSPATRSARSCQKLDPDAQPVLSLARAGRRAHRRVTRSRTSRSSRSSRRVEASGRSSSSADQERAGQLLVDRRSAERVRPHRRTRSTGALQAAERRATRRALRSPGRGGRAPHDGPRSRRRRLRPDRRRVRDEGVRLVTFGDVGTLEDPASIRARTGQRRVAVALVVRKQSGTNTVDVSTGEGAAGGAASRRSRRT